MVIHVAIRTCFLRHKVILGLCVQFVFFSFLIFLPSVGMGTLTCQFREDPSNMPWHSSVPPRCFDRFRVHTQLSLMEGDLEAGSLAVFPADRLSSSHDSRGRRDLRDQWKPQRGEMFKPRSHSKPAVYRGLRSRSLYIAGHWVTS